MTDYNPHSIDAVLARIEENQKAHGAKLDTIAEQAMKTNGRVNDLEREKWYVRGVTATLAILASAAWEAIKLKSR
jgi:hypothetical protein